MAKQKDPGFDLYWFGLALGEVDAFPDEIAKWPVDMLVEVDVRGLKSKFSRLAREVMDNKTVAQGVRLPSPIFFSKLPSSRISSIS